MYNANEEMENNIVEQNKNKNLIIGLCHVLSYC